MIGWRLGWVPRDLPLGRDDARWFLPWIFALMAYVAGLAGIGLIALHASLRAAETSLAATMTLQVPADTSKARLETVLALLRQTRGIVAAQVLTPAETARLLEPWLGPKTPLDQLPVPRLIDLRIDPAAPPEIEGLRHELASVSPEARLDEHRTWLAGARSAAGRIEIVLAAAIAAALLLVAAASVYAVRSALLVQRAAIEVLHLLGAPDSEVSLRFSARYLALGLLGGAVGAVAGVLTIVALGSSAALVQLPPPADTVGLADWRLWAALAAVVVATGAIAMASAQLTVLRRLARLP